MTASRIAASSLAAVMILSIGACTMPSSDSGASDSIKGSVDFPVGVAIDVRETSGEAGALVAAQFDQVTAENHMKPEAWYDADAQFRFNAEAKAITDFAAAEHLSVYGHTLVWHKQNPSWFFRDESGQKLTDSAADRDFLRDRLHTHIFAVAETFRNVYGEFGTEGNPIRAFDVVNEVIADESGTDGGLRESDWERILGERYIDLAFRYADEAFNDEFAASGADRPVTLFINDYDTEFEGKRERLHSLVSRLIDRGVPVDGIGHQFHTRLTTDVGDLGAALDAFDDLGLEQAVTELDVATGIPVDAAALRKQGLYYRDAFRIFRDRSESLFSVSLWGLTDDRSWRVDEGAPLVFTAELERKPAYAGIVDVAEDR